ncbi:hypothetical protein EDD15DRAFT_2369258 [Pisolithus albus]|nr:hypothetical protein EDD15DRAFT_2369258 [Pisolithus albus]
MPSHITESTDLIPLDGDIAKITRRAGEFKDPHDTLQRSLQIYLPLSMDCLATLHRSINILSAIAEATGQMSLTTLRKKEVEIIDGSESSVSAWLELEPPYRGREHDSHARLCNNEDNEGHMSVIFQASSPSGSPKYSVESDPGTWQLRFFVCFKINIMRLTYRAILLFLSLFSLFPPRYLALGVILWPIAAQVQQTVQSMACMTCGLDLLPGLLCQFIVPADGSTALFPPTVQTQFSALEGLLYDASEVAPLVSSLTESRLLVSDLASAVRASSLSSSAALAEELAATSTDTKEASRNLQKLLAQVHGTVDIMLTVNDHLLSLLRNRISPLSFKAAYCYVIGNSLHSDKCSSSSFHISQAFDRILFQFQHSLSLLILRAVEIQGNLDSVESRLEVVRDLVAMEASGLKVQKSDALSDILTVVGLNWRYISRLDSQMQALKDIARYRTAAARYLAGTFSGLEQLQETMELLRSLATGVGLIEGMPLETLIDVLTVGIQRLRGSALETGYSRGRPLLGSRA